MNGRTRHGIRLPSASLLLLPLFLAALCFSYALATADAALGGTQRVALLAKSRFLGQPLRFTHPFLQAGSDFQFPGGGNAPIDPDGFDLGDAPALGSVMRYITAAGGYQPYTFTLLPLLGSQADGGTNPSPALPSLSPAGLLAGQIPPAVGSFLRFNVGLADFVGSQRLGTFRLGIVPAGLVGFRFAQDALPRAQLGGSYFTNLETVGAGGSVVFSVVSASVWLQSGKTQNRFNSLEEVGLTLAPDGVLLGRPSKNGDIIFTAQAVDSSSGILAASRSGLGQSQTFTIPVDLNVPLNSEMLSASCSLRGNRVVAGSDNFSYSGYLDTRGYTIFRLAGSPVELRIGGAVFRGASNDKGQIRFQLGSTDAKGKKRSSGPSARLSPTSGRLTIRLTGVDLAGKIGLPTQTTVPIDQTLQTLVLGLDIGPFRTCEVLKMKTRALSRGSTTMAYILGKRGFSRAGGCQILTVVGADSAPLANPNGDRWLARCLTVPGQDDETQTAAPQVVLGGTKATIQVGDFSQGLTLTKMPVRLQFKGKLTDPGIYTLYLDPVHFVCRLQTNVLLSGDTNIPGAITTKNPIVFPMGVSFTGFNGQTGRIIAPNGRVWSQQ